MSVRPTQTKSGYPRRSRQPYPSAEDDAEVAGPASAGATVTAPGAEPVEAEDEPASPAATAEPVPPEAEPGLVTPEPGGRLDRRAQRAIRQSRRTLALVCVLLVAVCLVLTILIVNMARNRPAALGSASSAPVAVGPPAQRPHRSQPPDP